MIKLNMNNFLCLYRYYRKQHLEEFGYYPSWDPEYYYEFCENMIKKKTGDFEKVLMEAISIVVEEGF